MTLTPVGRSGGFGVFVAVALSAFSPALPSAYAQPNGFPDIAKFTEASGNFSRPDKWANGYAFFRTPDGISCAMGSTTWCSGDLPGLRAEQKGRCTFVEQKNPQGGPMPPFKFETSDDPCPASKDTVLNPGQKLTFTTNYTTTCMVGENQLTACIDADHKHGFVLQPSGSWTF